MNNIYKIRNRITGKYGIGNYSSYEEAFHSLNLHLTRSLGHRRKLGDGLTREDFQIVRCELVESDFLDPKDIHNEK